MASLDHVLPRPTPLQVLRAVLEWPARRAEALLLPFLALAAGFGVFAVFLLVIGQSPRQFIDLVWLGGFGSSFSIEATLTRTAPLILAALCVALPARLGLIVIGGEGAIVLGGLAAGAIAAPMLGMWGWIAIPAMGLAGMLAGGAWIGLVGALRRYRGVNETISSLLLAYIAVSILNHMVEGPLRDPLSLNKPSTAPVPADFAIGSMPWFDNVHWGFAAGILGCVVSWILIERTTWGFSARIAGGNVRAAQLQGLPVGRLVVAFTALGGAFAGLAGMFEVVAVQGSASGSLAIGYGYTGILIAFLARHNPLAIIPFAILLGGIEASGGLIQRRMMLPDATMLVLKGMLFVVVLLADTLYGRLKIFRPETWVWGHRHGG